MSSNTSSPSSSADNYNYGGLIYMNQATSSVTSLSNTYSMVYPATTGGVYTLTNSKLTDTLSTYDKCKGETGGAIYCQNCTLKLDSVAFSNLVVDTNGGVFYLNDFQSSLSSFNNITVSDIKSLGNGGVFYIMGTTGGVLNLTPFSFSGTISSSLNGGLIYLNNPNFSITIENKIMNATSTAYSNGGLIYARDAALITIESSTISYQSATSQGSVVYLYPHTTTANVVASTLIITNSNYYYQDISTTEVIDMDYSKARTATATSSFFAATPFYVKSDKISSVEIISTNNTFKDNGNMAKYGGMFYSENAIFTDTNSTFKYLIAFQGGALFLYNSKSTFTDTKFISNYAQKGGSIFLQDYSPTTFVSGVSATLTKAYLNGGFMMVYQQPTSNIYITFTVDLGNVNLKSIISDQGHGGGFYIDSTIMQLLSFYLAEITSVKTSTSFNGGVIYIANKGTLTNQYSFKSCLIKDLTAKEGRFIYQIPASMGTHYLNIENSTIQCKSDAVVYNEDAVLSNFNSRLLTTEGSTIYGGWQLNLTTKYNYFQYCYSSGTNAVLMNLNSGSTMQDTGSIIRYNFGLNGAAIKCTKCAALTFTSSAFYNNYSPQGPVLWILDSSYNDYQESTFTNVQIYNNEALHATSSQQGLGGAIYISETSGSSGIQTQTLTFLNCYTITNLKAYMGGFIYVASSKTNIVIYSSEISNISATSMGGMIYTTQLQSLTISSNTQVTDVVSKEGSMIYSMAESATFTFDTLTLQCNSTFNQTDGYEMLSLDYESGQSYKYTSAIYIDTALLVTSTDSTYQYCGFNKLGGVFSLYNTQLNDTSSTYQYNTAHYGGVINAILSKVYIKSSTFTYNYAYRGGVVQLSSTSFFYGKDLEFTYNQALTSAGVIYVSTESFIQLEASIFQNNLADENSVIEIIGGSQDTYSLISSTYFEENTARLNTLSFLYALAKIDNCYFQNNYADERSKNIFIGFSTVYITSSTFKDKVRTNAATLSLSDGTQGSYIFAILDVYLYITKCNFYNGISSQGGAIYISGEAYVYIKQSTFQNNYASTSGGAIYGSGFGELQITQSSKFSNNYGYSDGHDIYATNSLKIFNISQTSFDNKLADTSIYVSKLGFSMSYTSMINMYGGDSNYGGALRCIDCQYIDISQSNFTNMKAIYGGAISIEEDDTNKKTVATSSKYKIHNCIFQNATSNLGGALYLNNPQNLIISNCTFNNNKATTSTDSSLQELSGSGGAIYYTCNQAYLNCKVQITQNTSLSNNYASIKGGAIHWETLEPVFTSVKYSSNKALLYGNDVSCFAQRLATVNSTYYNSFLAERSTDEESLRQLQTTSTSSQLVTDTSIKSQQSGGYIPTTYMGLVDKYGQIVGSDSSSKIRAIVDTDFTKNNNSANSYPPVIEGSTQFQVSFGVVSITGIQLTATPGYNFSLSFTTDGIDTSKKSNKDYLSEQKRSDFDFRLYVGLRECAVGEQFTSNGKCTECSSGSSYSITQMKSPGNCVTCPTTKAVCYGGSNIGPKPGYWRKNNYTSTFIKCLYTEACLGMVAPDYNPIGSCFDGYQGILCADCQVGYSRTGDYECSICPEESVNIVRISGIILLAIILVVFMIKSTLAGAKDQNNVTSIYTKILMNHIQLIMLTASFDFKWPKLILEFFDSSKPVAQASNQIVSFDCFLDNRKSNTDSSSTRLFFYKLIMISIIPFICAIASFGFWYLYWNIKKKSFEYLGKAISTLIILLFLVHPSIVQNMFYNFKCMDVDGEQRVKNDLQVFCNNATHKLFSYFVAVPSIICWGIGIPFFALSLLIKVRSKLDRLDIKEKYGFLIRGKIVLIIISVFVSAFGVISQALIVFLLLIAFFFLNSKYRPFSTTSLNDLELMSLVTSIISVYCGLFFVSNLDSSYIKDIPELSSKALVLNDATELFFFAVIVIANIVFLAYWLAQMYQEIKNKIRKAIPKIYMIVLLKFAGMQVEEDIIAEGKNQKRIQRVQNDHHQKKAFIDKANQEDVLDIESNDYDSEDDNSYSQGYQDNISVITPQVDDLLTPYWNDKGNKQNQVDFENYADGYIQSQMIDYSPFNMSQKYRKASVDNKTQPPEPKQYQGGQFTSKNRSGLQVAKHSRQRMASFQIKKNNNLRTIDNSLPQISNNFNNGEGMYIDDFNDDEVNHSFESISDGQIVRIPKPNQKKNQANKGSHRNLYENENLAIKYRDSANDSSQLDLQIADIDAQILKGNAMKKKRAINRQSQLHTMRHVDQQRTQSQGGKRGQKIFNTKLSQDAALLHEDGNWTQGLDDDLVRQLEKHAIKMKLQKQESNPLNATNLRSLEGSMTTPLNIGLKSNLKINANIDQNPQGIDNTKTPPLQGGIGNTQRLFERTDMANDILIMKRKDQKDKKSEQLAMKNIDKEQVHENVKNLKIYDNLVRINTVNRQISVGFDENILRSISQQLKHDQERLEQEKTWNDLDNMLGITTPLSKGGDHTSLSKKTEKPMRHIMKDILHQEKEKELNKKLGLISEESEEQNEGRSISMADRQDSLRNIRDNKGSYYDMLQSLNFVKEQQMQDNMIEEELNNDQDEDDRTPHIQIISSNKKISSKKIVQVNYRQLADDEDNFKTTQMNNQMETINKVEDFMSDGGSSQRSHREQQPQINLKLQDQSSTKLVENFDEEDEDSGELTSKHLTQNSFQAKQKPQQKSQQFLSPRGIDKKQSNTKPKNIKDLTKNSPKFVNNSVFKNKPPK
eukprot:403369895